MPALQDPVVLKNQPRDFAEYCTTVRTEGTGAVAWLTEPEARWTVPASLQSKVAEDGEHLPYSGDTIVLPLDETGIDLCRGLQHHCRQHMGTNLASPLDASTFHVTLHDLHHGSSPQPLETSAKACRDRFAALAEALPDELAVVTLVPTVVHPCVNVSLVLGLVPATDRDFRTLMNVYNLFEDVVLIPHWPRLHVTLDYFRPVAPEPQVVYRGLPAPGFKSLTLDMRSLAYQEFSDMNHYRTVFTLSDCAASR